MFKSTKKKNSNCRTINFKGDHVDLSKARLYTINFNDLPNGNIISLDLRHNKLSGLPKFGDNLRYISTLRLDYNQFSHIPKPVFSLQLLETFTINHNFIVGIPSDIKALCHLKTLHISKNPIRKISKEIKFCTSITDICMDWLAYINFNSNRDHSRLEEAKDEEMWNVLKQVLYHNIDSIIDSHKNERDLDREEMKGEISIKMAVLNKSSQKYGNEK